MYSEGMLYIYEAPLLSYRSGWSKHINPPKFGTRGSHISDTDKVSVRTIDLKYGFSIALVRVISALEGFIL